MVSNWKEELLQIAERENLLSPGRGDIKPVLENVANKHNLKFNTIKTYFYKELRPQLLQDSPSVKRVVKKGSEETVNTKIEKRRSLTKENKDTAFDSISSTAKVGDIVQVKVSDIAPYGVFVLYQEKRGFIHISDVKYEFINEEKLRSLFQVGKVVEARIKKIEPDKLHLSTKGLTLAVINEDYKQEVLGNKNILEDELIDIIKYVNGVVGAVSPKAKERLQKSIEKHGIFKFSMAMLKVSQSFDVDPGLLFLQEVEKEMGGSL